jgi:DNA adenine methylase
MQKLFGYPGGKWPIRHTVIACFPEHTTYVDVFGGAASILIAKPHSKGEVFNDKNEQIVNFFRVVKHRPAELAELAQNWIHSRSLWNEVRRSEPSKDELERAFRTWVILVDSFASMGFHFGTARKGIRSVTRARMHLNKVADRFRDVHVECLDFAKCIRLYDSPDTFFYCDPPYRGTTGGDSNYDLLSDAEWENLFTALSTAKGRFLLSSNADDFVLRLFKKYHVRELDVRVTLPRKKGTQVRKEVLISNYKLPSTQLIEKRKRSFARTDGDREPEPGTPRSVRDPEIVRC